MKRTTRKSALFTAAAAAVLLAACSTPGTSGSAQSAGSQDLASPTAKSGTLSVITKFADPKYAPFFVDMARAYESANPGVKVDLQQVGDQPYKDKIRVLSASKSLPDVYFSWAGDFANKFIRGGLATDLTSVVGPTTEWGKTFSPAALKAFEYKGKNYGVPIDLDAKYLVYNKAAFEKAGLSGPPTSLEALLADCGKLKAAGYTPIAFGNKFGWPAIHYLTQLNTFNVPAATLAQDYDPATGAFTDPGYLWGRPSATGYDAHTSSGTNLGPRDPRLVAALTERAAALAATAPGRPVPIELITASASGLDPHVSPAAARFQIARIAAARGVTPAEVAAIVDAAVEPPTLGVLGASRVNVLAVNLALDRRLGRPRAVQ